MKIYLDVCCLNRPFDDQTQERIRLEAEAIISIFSHLEKGEWKILGSDIIDFEINQIPNLARKDKVQNLCNPLNPYIQLTPKIINRAKDIETLNITAIDALHISAAESNVADVFLTTDDQLVRKYQKHSKLFLIPIKNPLNWITEVL